MFSENCYVLAKRSLGYSRLFFFMYIIFNQQYRTVECLFSSGNSGEFGRFFSEEFGHLSSLINDEIVYFDIRGQNGILHIANMKIQHEPAVETDRPRSGASGA